MTDEVWRLKALVNAEQGPCLVAERQLANGAWLLVYERLFGKALLTVSYGPYGAGEPVGSTYDDSW
jgi:hypothetical protein